MEGSDRCAESLEEGCWGRSRMRGECEGGGWFSGHALGERPQGDSVRSSEWEWLCSQSYSRRGEELPASSGSCCGYGSS
jgi:hypothetical protein